MRPVGIKTLFFLSFTLSHPHPRVCVRTRPRGERGKEGNEAAHRVVRPDLRSSPDGSFPAGVRSRHPREQPPIQRDFLDLSGPVAPAAREECVHAWMR
jgi:hypothetical protein